MTRAARIIQIHTPSRLVLSAGLTSLTVLSTRTPPMRRKHLRSGSSVNASSSVVRTRLRVLNEKNFRDIGITPTCVRLPLTPIRRFFWLEPAAHFVIGHKFAGSLAGSNQEVEIRDWDSLHTLVRQRCRFCLCFYRR